MIKKKATKAKPRKTGTTTKRGRPAQADSTRQRRAAQKAERTLNDEREAWAKAWLRVLPKGLVCELTGNRQQKTLDEWAVSYGMPVAGATVDLFALVKWFSDRLAKHGRFEKQLEDDAEQDGDEDGEGGLNAAYTRAKTAKAKEDTLMQRVKREKVQEELVVKEIVHAALARLSDRLRAAGERCRARWGEDAVVLFDDLQAGFALDIDGSCASDDEAAELVEPAPPAV